MRPLYKAVKCVRHMAETTSFLISCYDYMKEMKILCSFSHCNLHAIVLSVVGQSHLIHMFIEERGVNQAILAQ